LLSGFIRFTLPFIGHNIPGPLPFLGGFLWGVSLRSFAVRCFFGLGSGVFFVGL
jgi:hypothetical protein